MAAELTVACVYKPGSGFTDEYVTRLRDNVAKFCAAPHRFMCLSTRAVPGVECEPLKRDRKGWWNKLELFRKGLFDGPVVYLDLDTILVDDVTDIFMYPHRFTALTNFKRGGVASGFLAWDARQDLSHLDDEFEPHMAADYEKSWDRWGDQGWIADRVGVPIALTGDLFPGRFVSFKWDVRRQGRIPAAASVVMFHGRPRPHEVGWRLPNGN